MVMVGWRAGERERKEESLGRDTIELLRHLDSNTQVVKKGGLGPLGAFRGRRHYAIADWK